MSDTSFDSLFHGQLRAASERLFWLGVAMVLLGIVALIFPMASTIVATLLVGWVLLLSGCITLIGSFSIHGTGPFFGSLVLALLSLAGGVFMMFNPLAGAAALTLMLGVIFMLQGAFELYFASELHPHTGWLGIMVSGIASIVIAFLIAAGWPLISNVLLGVFLGVNFISTGLAYIVVSRAVKPHS